MVTESPFDAIVMEDSECDGGLANTAGADERDGCEIVYQVNGLLDYFVTSETSPRCRRRRLSICAGYKHEVVLSFVFETADLD